LGKKEGEKISEIKKNWLSSNKVGELIRKNTVTLLDLPL